MGYMPKQNYTFII